MSHNILVKKKYHTVPFVHVSVCVCAYTRLGNCLESYMAKRELYLSERSMIESDFPPFKPFFVQILTASISFL